MSTPLSPAAHERARAIATLADLLERLEQQPRIEAGPYRQLVERLGQLLSEALPEGLREALLAGRPALAELYENQQYRHAGLSRHPLEHSVASEQAAREAITRAARRSASGRPA